MNKLVHVDKELLESCVVVPVLVLTVERGLCEVNIEVVSPWPVHHTGVQDFIRLFLYMQHIESNLQNFI